MILNFINFILIFILGISILNSSEICSNYISSKTWNNDEYYKLKFNCQYYVLIGVISLLYSAFGLIYQMTDLILLL